MSISRRLPHSDIGRTKALSTAKAKDASMPSGDKFLTTPTRTRLVAIEGTYKTALLNRGVALAAQTVGTAANDIAKDNLRKFASHFIQVFNLGIARGVYTKQQRSYFQIDVNSEALPPLSTESDLLLWAGRIVDGDAARVTAGGAAMSNPTAAQVATALTAFNTSNNAQGNLKSTYDHAQETVAALNTEADAVIKKVWDEVETFYNEEPTPSLRRHAREFGVIYISEIINTFNIIVYDSATGTPLSGATVEVVETGNTKTTGNDGLAQITSNVTDTANILCTLSGYKDQTVTVNLATDQTAYDVVIQLVQI